MYQSNDRPLVPNLIPLRDLRNWLCAYAHLEQKWQRTKPSEHSRILDRELNRYASLILATLPTPPEENIIVLDNQGRQYAFYLDPDWQDFAPNYSLAITCYPCIDIADVIAEVQPNG